MNSNKAPGPIVRVLRDATLPAILRLTADSKALREMYDYTVEWDERISVAA
jgi:FAD-dependent urate hydroxylase